MGLRRGKARGFLAWEGKRRFIIFLGTKRGQHGRKEEQPPFLHGSSARTTSKSRITPWFAYWRFGLWLFFILRIDNFMCILVYDLSLILWFQVSIFIYLCDDMIELNSWLINFDSKFWFSLRTLTKYINYYIRFEVSFSFLVDWV